MYKVLLVDDEVWVLEDLKTIIDWNQFGFEIVGQAKNAEEAKEQLAQHTPDVVICDIKMPNVDGIAFMESCRKPYPGLKIVFATAYGKFEYAKKAVDLGAFGYLLKPVTEDDLTTTLLRIKEVLDKERGISEKIKYLEQSKFIYSVIDGYSNAEELDEEFAAMGIQKNNNPIVTIVVKSTAEKEMFTFRENWLMTTVPLSNHKTLAILQYDKPSITIIGYKNLIKDLMQTAQEQQIVIGVSRVFYDMKKVRSRFYQADTAGDTFFINGRFLNVYRDSTQNIKKVTAFINYGKSNSSMQEVIAQLPEVVANYKINVENLIPILQHLVTQMGIPSEGEDLDIKDIISQFSDLGSYLQYLLNCMNENIKRGNGKPTSKYVIREITEYIHNNYNQKLMINTLAQRFFLNSSYLSNLFKVETGKSFTHYLVECRLNKAVELLENTDLSLYEISSKVGYDDYFHFSKLFKKYMNTSPANYRKSKAKAESKEE